MLKKLVFVVLGIFSVGFIGSVIGCDDVCLSSDRCYQCVKENIKACVPTYTNSIGTLDTYRNWNCTVYQEDTERLIQTICKVDNFVDELCNITVGNDDNGFCMIASYINDICQTKFHTEDHDKYVSPWGSESDCVDPFYKNICSKRLVKYCFDCRKFIGKELFTQKSRYSYDCSPYYISENEQEKLNWYKNEKYECRKWMNKHYKPSSFSTESVEPSGLYPACSGSICSKQGWQFQKTDFGKDWCGLGECKPYGRKYYCNFPTNCGKKTNDHFETLGCGKEKFKCILKKSCRQLLKQLDDCDKDQMCIFNLVVQNGDNEAFSNLVKCMV
jgi:hypothetical protein